MRIAGFPLLSKFLASASCLAWISAISFSLIYLLRLPPLAGWIIAGLLTLTAAVQTILFRLEMGHAIDIADYPEARFQTEAVAGQDFHSPAEPPGDICIF